MLWREKTQDGSKEKINGSRMVAKGVRVGERGKRRRGVCIGIGIVQYIVENVLQSTAYERIAFLGKVARSDPPGFHLILYKGL